MSDKTWLFTDRALLTTPSIISGSWSTGTETHTRLRACRYIERCARRLGLPHDMQATAKILLHRFYMRASLKECEYHDVASSVIFICGKLGDGRNFKHIEQIISVCANDAAKSRTFAPIPETSSTFIRWKNTIMAHEEHILQLLCYDMSPELPHPRALELIKKNQGSISLQKLAFFYCDEALCTTLSVRYSAIHIAQAAVHAARLTLRGNDPRDNGAEWHQGSGLDLLKLKALALEISLAADDIQLSRLALVRETKIKDLLKSRKIRRAARAASRRPRPVTATNSLSPRSAAVPGTPSTGVTDTSPQWSPSKQVSSTSPPFAPVPDQTRTSNRPVAAAANTEALKSSNYISASIAQDSHAVRVDNGTRNMVPPSDTFISPYSKVSESKVCNLQPGYRHSTYTNGSYSQNTNIGYKPDIEKTYRPAYNPYSISHTNDASLCSTGAGAMRTTIGGHRSYNPYARPSN
ncbi:hypothetical protein O5D80_008482 [Batrachochytrium dendrobatidis]|nr:hypothetical protein O5D80_008482 [Batrachochytrium dendrobatidis]